MQLGPKQVEQLALPLDRGGLGIQSAVATGEVAFLASALSSLDLQKQLSGKDDYSVRQGVEQARAKLGIILEREISVEDLTAHSHPQAFFSKIIMESKVEEFRAGLGPDALIKFHSVSRGGGQFWGATPNKLNGTVLSNLQFATVMRVCMNLPVSRGENCVCCGISGDPMGYHSLSCNGKGGGMWSRHRGICLKLLQLLKRAEIVAVDEAKGLFEDSAERPADILIPVGENGVPQAVDVTVVHSCNSSSRAAALHDPEHVLKSAVQKKYAHYREKCTALGMKFTPFAVDVYGQLHSESIRILERIAQFIAANSGEEYSKTLRGIKVEIQATLYKQVAQMIQLRG
jgi:hypothetical protein